MDQFKLDIEPGSTAAAQKTSPAPAAPAQAAAPAFKLDIEPGSTSQQADGSLFDQLLWQESRGRQMKPDGTPVVSPKGAVGIAQIMPATAPEAAALAGEKYDPARLASDAEYNKKLGRAYFNKQLQDFGNPEMALAAYNAGPQAVRNALTTAQRSGNPDAWLSFLPAETRTYVPTILGRASSRPASSGSEDYTNYQAKPAPKRDTFATVNDFMIDAGNAAAGLVKSGVDLFAPDSAASKFIDEQIIKDGESKQSDYKKYLNQKLAAELQEAGINDGSNYGEIAAEARKAGVQLSHALTQDPVGTIGQVLGNVGPFALLGRGMAAAKLANGVRSAISAGVAGGLSAGEVRGNIWEKISSTPDADLQKSSPAYAELRKRGMDEQAAKREIGANFERNFPELAMVGLVGALSGKFGPEAMATGVAPKYAMGRPGAAVLGFLDEGPLQGGAEQVASNVGVQRAIPGQSLIEGVGPNIVAEGIPGAAMGAAFGGHGGNAHVPPALAPVAEKAAEPNSPLSRAAMAGAPAAAEAQANQESATTIDPMSRLAELESIGRGSDGQPGRIFTKEEKAEYDELKTLRDSTPGMTPEDIEKQDAEKAAGQDEIFDRASAISTALQTNRGLQRLRAEDSPTDVKSFLSDLALAKSKSAPAVAREQAMHRLDFVANWLGLDIGAAPQKQSEQPAEPKSRTEQVAGMISAADLSPQDRSDAVAALASYRNPKLPEATRQAALDRALEIVGRTQAPSGVASEQGAPAVLNDIPPQPGTPEFFEREADRRESGAFQFAELGYAEEAQALRDEAMSLREAAASARAGELGMEDSAEADASIASPVNQQTVDEATQGLPRVQIPPEAPGAAPEDNTAARRKRKAQLGQLAAAGFDTVERRDGVFVLRNTKTGQEILLDSPADAQVARLAIKSHIDSVAHTAAASPLNDRKEPTQAQIDAGNYKKSDVIDMNGVRIVIENPAGSVRSGIGADGKRWESKMVHHYGEILGTEGADGDRVDVFIGNRPDSNKIFIIDQVNEDGSFDEHKLVFGATSEEDARRTYLANYEPGWTGLGAIKEIAQEDLKQWLRNDSKKPASESEIGRFTVQSNGKVYTLRSVPVDSLPTAADSTPRGPDGARINKQQALLIKGLAGFFGKEVTFFSDPERKVNADGFVKPDDLRTIYLNEYSGISPAAVFGHELMHILRRENPEAYAAIEAVVRERVKDPNGFRNDYAGKLESESEAGGDSLSDTELEELISDLNGNLMGDQSFWKDVFEKIKSSNGAKAKGIIAQLAAFIDRLISAVSKEFASQPKFRAGKFVSDMDAIRAALRDGLAKYASENGMTKQAIAADVAKAKHKLGDIKRRVKAPEDGMTVEAYHFSQQPRQMLSTGLYGSGLQGSDREEILGHEDRRLRDRLYFYVNKGTGVRPESGVGGIAHKAVLSNIYDSDADVKRLKQGRGKREFESAVLDAGYSGYLTRLDGSQPGQVILLGPQTVKPEVLGMRTQVPEAKVVPAPAARDMDLGDKILANKALPSGSPTLSRWAQILMATMPAEAAQMMDAGVFDGPDNNIYKDELVAKLRAMSGQIKASSKRERAEYDAVVAKYKDTDEWMKAPNGGPTSLSERQWVQVRTPSFKSWFGDWEQAHKDGGVWATKLDVSKVVGDNGEPLVVYHGTDKGGFNEFERPGGKSRGDLGIFATDNWEMARSYVRKNSARNIEESDVGAPDDAEVVDLGFDLPNGNRWALKLDGGKRQSYYKTEEEAREALDAMGGEKTSGIYALFLNVRNPNEDHFDGAHWTGERPEQYQVRDENDEPVYDADGSAYFDRETAERLADENDGAEVQAADAHYQTTDDVVREAHQSGQDGAIIRAVVDDGGGPGGYSFEPSDVFVALRPEQVKSADFNGGEFSPGDSDIRRATKRTAERGKLEEVGEYQVRVFKDGSISVESDPEELRQLLPDGVTGRKTSSGLTFTHSDAPRVRAALEGRSLAYSRAGTVITRLPMRDGKYLGAPEKYNTPAKIGTLRRILRQLADEGAPGRFWYENSSRAVLRMTGGNVDEARKFVALLAIYSPQAKVDANSTFALRAWAQYKAGQPISVKTGVMDSKAQRALDNVDEFWSGEKTGNFFFNLLREIDPSTEGKQGATIDMWMMRAGQYGNDAPTSTQYAFMENETNRLAADLGWEPQQVQAAIWVAMKARMENLGVKKRTEARSEKRGWIRFENDVVDGKAKKRRVIIDAEKHRQNWLDEAFKLDVGAEDTQAAKFDFEDGLRRHIGQVSWEARPSTSSGVLPGIHTASYDEQVEFQQAVQKALYGPNGEDLLAIQLGLLDDRGDILAPGAWEGVVSPSSQKQVPMAPAKGDAGKSSVDPAQQELLNVYSAVLGMLLHQDGVGWHRPFWATTKKQANGLDIRIGRPLTEQEMLDVSAKIDAYMVANGKPQWQNDMAIISSPAGVRVVNFGAITNEELHRDLVREIEGALPDADAFAFASDGDMPTNNWKENPNGQDYAQRIGEAGRSDVLDWAGAVLAPRIQSVFDDFSRRYNWGNPGRHEFAAAGSDDVAVREQGGLRRSARRLAGESGPDQGLGREEDGSLRGLPRNFTVAGKKITASHWAPAEKVARAYMAKAGLQYNPPATYAKVDPQRAARIAAEYDKLKHDPQNPEVKAAYEALARETIAQYQAVVDSGLKVEFIDFEKQGDPYAASPRLATEDVRENNHMWVFSTRDGFGTDASFDPAENPLLAETDHIISGKRALVNDLFRVVHDYFGHVKEGVGFRADGEENTWRAHSAMFSPLAQRALTTETRGQNSWLNFGPYGESNRTAKVEDTHFADQKTGLLPLWVSEEGRHDDVQVSPAEYNRRIEAVEELIACLRK